MARGVAGARGVARAGTRGERGARSIPGAGLRSAVVRAPSAIPPVTRRAPGVPVAALRATFARRGTALPASPPIALTQAFAADPVKGKQWHAFVTKAGLQADLDAWLDLYNNQREHQGRWCYGKTPMRTFLDSLDLAKEKLIAQQ